MSDPDDDWNSKLSKNSVEPPAVSTKEQVQGRLTYVAMNDPPTENIEDTTEAQENELVAVSPQQPPTP